MALLSWHGGLWTSFFVIYTTKAHHLAKWFALLSWAVLMHSTFMGILTVLLPSGFFKFVHSMFQATGSSVLELVSKLPPKSTLHVYYRTGSYKALNRNDTSPIWLMFHCTLHPTPPNTWSYFSFPHDATHLSSIANLQPSAYYGPSCTFFSLRIQTSLQIKLLNISVWGWFISCAGSLLHSFKNNTI